MAVSCTSNVPIWMNFKREILMFPSIILLFPLDIHVGCVCACQLSSMSENCSVATVQDACVCSGYSVSPRPPRRYTAQEICEQWIQQLPAITKGGQDTRDGFMLQSARQANKVHFAWIQFMYYANIKFIIMHNELRAFVRHFKYVNRGWRQARAHVLGDSSNL